MGTSSSTWGRRVRAALVLSGASVDDAAAELNVSRKTLERTMRGERAPRPWETRRLAEVLDVPLWFLEDGFDGVERRLDDSAIGERLDRIERLLMRHSDPPSPAAPPNALAS